MITLAIFGIVIAVAFAFTVSISKANEESMQRVKRIGEFDFVFQLFNRYGLEAERVRVIGASEVQFDHDTATGEIYTIYLNPDPGSEEILWDSPTGDPMVVATGVTALRFEQDGPQVRMVVDFRIEDNWTFTREQVVVARNIQ